MALSRWSRSFPGKLNSRLSDWFSEWQEERKPATDDDPLFPPRWRPKSDVFEEDGNLVFKVETPGLHKNDLDVQLGDGVLTISGERREQRDVDDEEKDYYRSERFYGRFQRSFSLPESVKHEDVKAEYEDGILTVRVPRPGRSQKSEIEIS